MPYTTLAGVSSIQEGYASLQQIDQPMMVGNQMEPFGGGADVQHGASEYYGTLAAHPSTMHASDQNFGVENYQQITPAKTLQHNLPYMNTHDTLTHGQSVSGTGYFPIHDAYPGGQHPEMASQNTTRTQEGFSLDTALTNARTNIGNFILPN